MCGQLYSSFNVSDAKLPTNCLKAVSVCKLNKLNDNVSVCVCAWHRLENRSLQEQLETTRSKASETQLELEEKLAQAVTEITLLHHTLRGLTNELHAALKDQVTHKNQHQISQIHRYSMQGYNRLSSSLKVQLWEKRFLSYFSETRTTEGQTVSVNPQCGASSPLQLLCGQHHGCVDLWERRRRQHRDTSWTRYFSSPHVSLKWDEDETRHRFHLLIKAAKT